MGTHGVRKNGPVLPYTAGNTHRPYQGKKRTQNQSEAVEGAASDRRPPVLTID